MKTCDEMVNSLLKRREQFLIEQKQKRRKTAVKIAVSGAYCALAAVIGTGIWHSVISSNKISENSSVISENSFPASSEPEKITPPVLDRSRVIWAGSDADAEDVINSYIVDMVDAFDSFNGKTITKMLSEAFKEHDDNSVFAVGVFYFPYYDENRGKDFIYNGKTLDEYDKDEWEKWCRSMDRRVIEKNAEYLINGEEYYQNDIWAKTDYERAMILLDERQEVVSEYFVDGEYLEEKLLRDLETANEEYRVSKEAYDRAYSAWKTSLLEKEAERLTSLGINCELRTAPELLVMFVTKDEFSALTFDNDSGNWVFGLVGEDESDVLGWLVTD